MSLWDIVQAVQIDNLQKSQVLAETSSDIRHGRQTHRADDLEDDVAMLVLALDAMWSILSERLGVTPEELRSRMEQIDLADGRRDGRYQAPPRRCPSCDAAVSSDQARCQFCGADTPGAHPFAR